MTPQKAYAVVAHKKILHVRLSQRDAKYYSLYYFNPEVLPILLVDPTKYEVKLKKQKPKK